MRSTETIMSLRVKEWIVNGFLLAGIVGLLVLIALGTRGPSLPDETGDIGIPAQAPGPTPAPAGAETANAAASDRPDSFPNLGTLDVFRECITPTPKPTSAPPAPLPTPSLQEATDGWEYQYPVRRKGIHVFLDTKENKEIEISEKEWKPFLDKKNRAMINIIAEPKSKTEVNLKGVPVGGEGVQTRTMSF